MPKNTLIDTLSVASDSIANPFFNDSITKNLTIDTAITELYPSELPPFFLVSPSFWTIFTGFLTLVILIYMILEKSERKRLKNHFVGGKRFRSSQINYSLNFFSGARIDKNTNRPSIYTHREAEVAITDFIKSGRNVILLGTPLRGKTRIMVECIRKIKNADVTICLPSQFDTAPIFPRRKIYNRTIFCKKHILVLDDLNDFIKVSVNLKSLIDTAIQAGFIIIANCRSSGEWKSVLNEYDTISKRFEIVEIPFCSEAEVQAVIKCNNLDQNPSFFDGKNIGTLIVDLDTMRDRYSSIKGTSKDKLLRCIIELYTLGVNNDNNEIERKNIKILAETSHDLAMSFDILNEELQWLVDKDFITSRNHGIGIDPPILFHVVEPEIQITNLLENGYRAFTREQINYRGIIYSAPDGNSAWFVINFMRSKGIRPSVHEYNQLLDKQKSIGELYHVYNEMVNEKVRPTTQTYYRLINASTAEPPRSDHEKVLHQQAEYIFEKTPEINLNVIDYYYWGCLLKRLAFLSDNDQSIYKMSIEKFKLAGQMHPNFHFAYTGWGDALTAMAMAEDDDELLYLDACRQFEYAIQIEPMSSLAYSKWGAALTELARKRVNDESIYYEAFEKFSKATDIDDQQSSTFVNWGLACYTLACNKDNDEALFTQAFDKYDKAIKIDNSNYAAYYLWGIALESLALTRGNDLDLFADSILKYSEVIRIKPDHYGALSHWGFALDRIGNLKSDDEKLLSEACDKFEQAFKILAEPIMITFWGCCLLRRSISHMIDKSLLISAIDKFKSALGHQPDNIEALYYCAEALELLAPKLNNSDQLLAEANEKRMKAQHLQPNRFDDLGKLIEI